MQKRAIIFFLFLGAIMTASESLFPKNFHRINNGLYRSSQPSKYQFEHIKDEYNIRTVINLRDKADPVIRGMNMVHIPMLAWYPTKANVVNFIEAIKNLPHPVLIHCLHGSDRTGMMVAIYRLYFYGWTKERALQEMKKEKFGFHDEFWNRTDEFIEKLDLDWLRSL